MASACRVAGVTTFCCLREDFDMRCFRGGRFIAQPGGGSQIVYECEGVEFVDGSVVLNWCPLYADLLVFPSFEDFWREHMISLIVVVWRDCPEA